MQVERLAVQRFRNLAAAAIVPRRRVVLLVGDNGAGKTNLLEALFLCATGRSFRLSPPREMVTAGADAARIDAVVSRQGVRHDVAISLTRSARQIAVDGRGLRQSTRLLELLNMVAFFPDDLRIVRGSPEERRRFLDRAVANYAPRFAAAAIQYARTLRSRNALLRGARSPAPDLLQTYDHQLARLGGEVHAARSATLAALHPAAGRHFAALLPALPPLTVTLADGLGPPGSPADGPDTGGASQRADPAPDLAPIAHGDPALAATYAARMLQALRRDAMRDRARGLTHAGPHRADLQAALGGRSLRTYGSQGQMRCLVLALKLAEVVVLTERLGTPPILLLDDVSSELDAARTRALFTVVGEAGCQVWVSTTGTLTLPVGEASQTVQVRDGTVSNAAEAAL